MTPPKIEELPDEEPKVAKPPKKNPFALRPKKTTIQRSVDEVYPLRKGLNKPEIKSTKPIDLLFEKLENVLDLEYDQLTIDVLYQRLFNDKQEFDSFTKRYEVIEQLLDYLIDIQKLSMNSIQNDDKNLIAISLHDLKTFSKLLNVIIIHGVYPPLNILRIGIQFEKRQLKNFSNNKNLIKIDKLPQTDFAYIEKLLTLIYTKLLRVLLIKSDVASLLLKGTGYTDFLVVAITLIVIPQFNSSDIDFAKIESIASTFELYQTYSLLLTTPSPAIFKKFVMSHLGSLHYSRPNGILTLIEFVLGLRDQEEINIEKFDNVANVVLQKPANVDTKSYFMSVGNQMYDLLININRPNVTSCVAYVLEKLWQRNKLVVTDFVLQRIWNNFNPPPKDEGILVTEAQLNNNINVILSLTKKGLEPDLYQAVIQPVLLPLWGYYTFLKQNGKEGGVALNILTSYFTLMKGIDDLGLPTIAKNLLYKHGENWKYEFGDNNLTQIVTEKPEFVSQSKESKINKFLNDLDFACELFVKVLEELDDSLIQQLFVKILNNWLNNDTQILGGEERDPFLMLLDLRLLEKIGEKFRENLATNPIDMLELVQSFLSSYKPNSKENEHSAEDSDDEMDDDELEFNLDQTITVLLQLLSAIISENDIILDNKGSELLSSIKKILSTNSQFQASSLKGSADALCTRIESLLSNNNEILPANESEAQKQILQRAITNLNDPLVPIRAHGLYLLRQLIEMKSSVITLDFAINLHLVQLKDPEPFIYLNVIKGLETLIEWNEPLVLDSLCKLYLQDDVELDEKLRIGEVILRYIQRAGQTFTGNSAKLIVETTLAVIRRAGNNRKDDRLRMSSMSLLGTCCKVNPLGMIDNLNYALDASIGILELETDKEQAIMRRAAIMLIYDLILGTSETDKVEFPQQYKSKVITVLRYVAETDNDLLVREQAQKVFATVEELIELAMELYKEENQVQ